MCTFITTIVPDETALPQLSELCEKHGFSVNLIKNASVSAMMQGYQFLPLGGCCHCHIPLGYAHQLNINSADLDAEVSKLKRKGWS